MRNAVYKDKSFVENGVPDGEPDGMHWYKSWMQEQVPGSSGYWGLAKCLVSESRRTSHSGDTSLYLEGIRPDRMQVGEAHNRKAFLLEGILSKGCLTEDL